ncbi:unnamed protein product [Polarella glacialis]|uniref:Polynucleotide adenylyltransferase n=1 Tax=Polarella glacialis TaxID=89957 RepID=A0A813JGI7_POLGL|nr:unnamed protein product [Polarella glacialis]
MMMSQPQMAHGWWGDNNMYGGYGGGYPEESYPNLEAVQQAPSVPPHLGSSLFSILEASKPGGVELQKLTACVQGLQAIVEKLGPGWQAKPFGSAANGFATRGSDLDVTCFHTEVDEQDAQLAIQELKLKLLPLLREEPRFEIIEEVWSARVPILKMRFEGDTEVDLSCHNLQALQNTYLLWVYSKLHPVVRGLVITIKLWAKAEGVCGAALRHLSTYSLTLMAIFFLQVHPSWRLPCLPTWGFGSGGVAKEVLGITWESPGGLPELVCGFFRFYVADFQWGQEVVSVRLGRRAFRNEPDFFELSGRVAPRMHIEDPFLLSRNLNCILGSEQEQQLQEKMQSVALALAARVVPSVFTLSAFPAFAEALEKDKQEKQEKQEKEKQQKQQKQQKKEKSEKKKETRENGAEVKAAHEKQMTSPEGTSDADMLSAIKVQRTAIAYASVKAGTKAMGKAAAKAVAKAAAKAVWEHKKLPNDPNPMYLGLADNFPGGPLGPVMGSLDDDSTSAASRSRTLSSRTLGGFSATSGLSSIALNLPTGAPPPASSHQAESTFREFASEKTTNQNPRQTTWSAMGEMAAMRSVVPFRVPTPPPPDRVPMPSILFQQVTAL